MKTKPKPNASVDLTEPVSENANLSLVPCSDSAPLGVDEVVREAVDHIRSGLSAARKGWHQVLSGALRLIWLQTQHTAQGARNDLVPDGKKSGFCVVLDELGLASSTTYRWMEQARGFLAEIGVCDENMPSPGSDEWSQMQRYVLGRVDVLCFLKLPVRVEALPADEEVLTRLRTAAELGDKAADELLDRLAAGEILLDEATKKYCRVEPPKHKDPPMLKLDPKTLQPKGRMVKALITLEECFANWQNYDPEARIQAAQLVRTVIAQMPKECDFKSL